MKLLILKFAFAFAILILLFFPSPSLVLAQQNPGKIWEVDPNDDPWNHIDGMASMLNFRGVSFYAPGSVKKFSIHDFMEDPRRGKRMLILLGRNYNRYLSARQVEEFVLTGGKLLLASDHYDSGEVLAKFGVHLSETHFQLEQAITGFQGFPDCPFITSFSNEAAKYLRRKVSSIVTNKALVIEEYPSSYLSPWAFFPENKEFGDSPVFMVAGKYNKGFLAVLGDHSPFINLLIGEADNFAFCESIFQWFNQNGEVDEVLVIFEGKLIGFDPNKKSPISFDPDAQDPWKIENINRSLRALSRRSESFNRMIAKNAPDENFWPWLSERFLTMAALFGFLVMLSVFFFKGSKTQYLTRSMEGMNPEDRRGLKKLRKEKDDWDDAARIAAQALLLWLEEESKKLSTAQNALSDPGGQRLKELPWQLSSLLKPGKQANLQKSLSTIVETASGARRNISNIDYKNVLLHIGAVRENVKAGFLTPL